MGVELKEAVFEYKFNWLYSKGDRMKISIKKINIFKGWGVLIIRLLALGFCFGFWYVLYNIIKCTF